MIQLMGTNKLRDIGSVEALHEVEQREKLRNRLQQLMAMSVPSVVVAALTGEELRRAKILAAEHAPLSQELLDEIEKEEKSRTAKGYEVKLFDFKEKLKKKTTEELTELVEDLESKQYEGVQFREELALVRAALDSKVRESLWKPKPVLQELPNGDWLDLRTVTVVKALPGFPDVTTPSVCVYFGVSGEYIVIDCKDFEAACKIRNEIAEEVNKLERDIPV